MSDTMETSVSHRRIIPRTEDQVGQSAMDNLRAHLKKEVIVTRTALPGAASLSAIQTLIDVVDFRSISTEFKIYPYKSITPFLAKNSAILRIAAVESGDVLYANTFLKADGRDVDIGYISRILTFDIDTLRRLSFGCDVADRLRMEDTSSGVRIRE